MVKIATWNINSVRIRLALLKKLTEQAKPDIICLQETKVTDDLFPLDDLKAMGYTHTHFSGQKSYNGVAILSKLPLSNIYSEDFINEDKRHIAATLPDGTELHNLYIPAGGDEPDPVINPKFAHKLSFVEALTKRFKTKHTADDKLVIVGDFNIAPLEHDVWSHKQLLKIVSHTPIELEHIEKLRESLGWIDSARVFTPDEEKLYSWWSYRNRDWKKSNRGRRLDHIWVTPILQSRLVQG